MTHRAKFEAALQGTEPYEQLRGFAQELVAEGQTQQQVYNLFEQFRAYLRNVNRENDEGTVMDVMDIISGWCSPGQRLFD